MTYLTHAQAAALACVTRDAIRKAVLRGELSDITIAGRHFVDAVEVHSWWRRPRFRASGRPKKAAQ